MNTPIRGDNQDEPSKLPTEACDRLRKTGGELIRELGLDDALIGACAIHTGIQFLLRNYESDEVARWLEHEARELREFAKLKAAKHSPKGPA